MKIAKNEKCGVVEFLESAEAATLEERRLHRRLEALETRCDGLRVRGGAVERKLEKMILAEREREVAVVNEELESYRRVEAFVARVPGRVNRTILRRKYLDVGKNWTEIAEELARDGVFYSQRHLLRLHAQAVEAAQKLWDEERGEETVKGR